MTRPASRRTSIAFSITKQTYFAASRMKYLTVQQVLQVLPHQGFGSYPLDQHRGRTGNSGGSVATFAVPSSTLLGCATGWSDGMDHESTKRRNDKNQRGSRRDDR